MSDINKERDRLENKLVQTGYVGSAGVPYNKNSPYSTINLTVNKSLYKSSNDVSYYKKVNEPIPLENNEEK